MSTSVDLHVLVLAAGAARRFGSPKQLVRVAGEPLLHGAVARATQVAGHGVTVVLGAYASDLAPLLRHTSAAILINRQWNEGLASSLRQGVGSLPGTCDGVMVTLADQAAVSVFDLQRLASAWRRQPDYLLAASYGGQTGVPAIFPRWTFPDFARLHGDVGARALLLRYSDRCLRIPMPDAAIDIDTPEDLLQLRTPSTSLDGAANDPQADG
jgi:molybdenum cofactor cytidylyltransferase